MNIISDKFESLFKDHFHTAVLISHKIVSSSQTAEDIVQDVFIKMLDINLDTISSPSSYLFRAVRNASIDYLRSPDNVLHRDMLTNIIDVSVYDETV